MTELPRRPAPPSPNEDKQGSLLALLMASGLGVTVIVVLLFLTLGMFAWVVAAVVCLFLVAALHYLVWGFWLERSIRAEVEEEDRRIELDRARAAAAAANPRADEDHSGGGATPRI